jgi:hypothetical protein
MTTVESMETKGLEDFHECFSESYWVLEFGSFWVTLIRTWHSNPMVGEAKMCLC